MSELEILCKYVNELAKKVGNFIAQQRTVFDETHIQYKAPNDLVSYVDKEAEKKLVEGLHNLLPEAAFISEENRDTHEITPNRFHWIIDPLDGTTNFIHGLPVYSVSIGLMEGNEIVLGVVYEINHQECFYAIRNKGAFCNGNSIKVSKVRRLSESLVATGFPYHFFDKNTQYLAILDALMQKSHGLRRLGSAAVDLAYTACGRFDGFFEFNLKPWDVAAGSLLVQEAGGIVSTFDGGNDFVFGREMLAAGATYTELQAIIQKFWS